jgi:hypothetical protein
MRRAARRDDNEQAIVEALEAMGCSVDRLNGVGTPDLLVGLCGRLGRSLLLLEVKGYAGQLTDDQIAWHRRWKGPPPVIVRSVEDAIAVVQSVQRGQSA